MARILIALAGSTLLGPLGVAAQAPGRTAGGGERGYSSSPAEIALARAEQGRAAAAASKWGGSTIHLDGALAPALFMPWELFNALVRNGVLAEPPARDVFRTQVISRLADWEDREDLWDALESSSSTLVRSLRQQLALATGIADLAPADKQDRLGAIGVLQAGDCAARREAMDRLIELWGEPSFRKLLYVGVAPGLQIDADPEAETAARLLFVEGGCK